MKWAEIVGDRAVLDASVAIRWFVEEPGSDAALALFTLPTRWLAPRLLLSEFAGALARKAELGDIRAVAGTQAMAVMRRMVQGHLISLADDEAHIDRAYELAVSIGHRVADCLYLALAEATHLPLATADGKMARLAKRQRIPVALVPSI